jgi:hypothetical protein
MKDCAQPDVVLATTKNDSKSSVDETKCDTANASEGVTKSPEAIQTGNFVSGQ